MSGASPRELKLEIARRTDGTVGAKERVGAGGAVMPTASRQTLRQQLAVGAPPGQQLLSGVPGSVAAGAAESQGISADPAAVVPAAAAAYATIGLCSPMAITMRNATSRRFMNRV
jgi:hypothetical protein